MKDIVGKILNEIKTNRIKLRRMRRILLVLSLLVATAVVWQLKITGITMTGEALCGYLEHRHTESCLRTVEICGLQETDGHSHGTDCYKVLRCTEEVHDHGDACYETVELPVCGKEEAEEHHHSEECLQESYICGYQQEHAHSPLCYSNLEADLESSSDWEKTIPALIQDPAADLAAVARSQLGYMESQQNYKLADDGVTQMGYTRYGEWYGNPYGKWNAMFVSFCLRYAEHPAYETLKNSGSETMRLAAEDAGVYHEVAGTVPGVGDLVFLDKDGNGTCETVAIVSVCEEGGVYLVEGDCDGVVAENRYALDDSAIAGYAILTAQPETTEELVEEEPKVTEAADNPPEDNEVVPAAGDGITVTFVINKQEYTDDPGNHTTHLTVESTDGLTADGGLTYTAWEGTDKFKVTGNGTLASFTLPAETAFAGNGYAFPTVKVENMTPEEGRQYTYASAYNWVTETGLICNEKTVFPKSTTLYLCLYESGKTCGLNWVCNCNAGGTHSITYYVSGFGSPVFTWGQSLSEPYIPTVAAVNSGYTGSQYCTAGPDYGMQLKGWYVKDAEGNEIDFSAGTPILESYKDKDSNGYSVKIYARWEKTEQNIETVTATFVNGEKMDTVSLNKGGALGNKLPVVTAPEGQVFVGWKIGDTTDYATAETVIETDTIYTAVFVSNVTITFMHDGVQYGEAVTVPEGTPLWGYLPAQEPEYSGDGDTPMIFAGWKIGDTDHLVKEDTLAEAGMVLHAVFAEVPNYKVYMHDIAPDGKTDYETQGGNASTDRLLPEGSTLAQYLEENDFFMHHDDARASSCKWYTEQEQEGTVTYVPYDLQSPITSELHLYTFNYSVTLTLQEAVTTGSFLNLFPVASAAEVVVNGNTLTMTLREGEKPTAADFVKGEVDYSVYNWSFKDGSGNELELTLADVLKNGVTGNITATSSENDRAIVASATAEVLFQIIVNNERKDLGQQDVTVYKLNETESYSISQETLKSVYAQFGFTVEDWVQHPHSFPQQIDNNGYWANHPLRQANGLYYNPSVANPASSSEVLYLPQNDAIVYGESWEKYKYTHSFYTVTITDPERMVYQDESRIPAVQYVFTGKNATVTVPSPTGIKWKYTGINATDPVNVTETDNGDGTKTFTFTNVTSPIVLTPVYDDLTTAEKTIHFYVYVNNQQVLVESGTYPVYASGIKHYVSASLLEKVYGAYGFTADQLNSTDDCYFPHTHEGGGTVYANVSPAKVAGGIWLSPILNTDDPRNCDVYYAPGFTGTDSAQTSLLASDYSFYTVTVTDPENLLYGTDEKMPDAKFVFTENNASVTVKTSGRESITVEGGRYYWLANGVELTNGVPNGDGTTTYTVANVTEPVVLVPKRNFVTVRTEDPNHLIYENDGDIPPAQQVLKEDTAVITRKIKPGVAWIANGRTITGGVYRDNETAIEYTFTDVAEDILLTPVAILSSYTINYELNLNQYAPNPSNQAPQIEVTSEAYAGGENPYPVRIPNRLEYTTTGNASYNAVVFDGWIPEGNRNVLLGEKDALTLEQMAAMDANGDGVIDLTAKWTNLGYHGSVSFYVNLELRVADYAGSAGDTGNKNYTDVLYGTGVTITPLPGDAETAYEDINVLQAAGEAATAEIDAKVRMLAADGGVKETYMGQERHFKLNSFPKDEYILETVRAKQTEYLAAYNAWRQNGEDQNGDGIIDADDYRSKTGQKIIEIDGEPIPVKDINSDNYTIRWYVFKYERSPDENGWHIDGVLVKKQAQLTVTKTFYGDTAAVAEVKKNYTIDVVGIDDTDNDIDKKPTLYTLTLNSQTTQQDQEDTEGIEQGYTDYDPTTDTYTWVVNLTADWKAWLYEKNYSWTQNEIVTLAEYLSYNFTNTSYNRSRTTYDPEAGVEVAVKSHSVDQDYRTFETVAFYNTYLPSEAVPINKVDDTGKPLTGVSFYLNVSANGDAKRSEIWQDENGIYYIYSPTNVGAVKVDTGYITVDDMGYALVMGLKDKSLNYSFELVEATAPEGYTSIGVPIAFKIDDSGIHLTQNSAASSPDGHTIHVTNTSKMTSVKAVKQWQGETNKKVTLQLLLDDTPLPGKVVELDGIVDTPADGMTDGYESEAWTVVWNNLPAYTGGSRAVYRIKETWIGDSAYSGEIEDGYENYDVQYATPEYDTTGDVPTVILKVTNQVATTEVELRKVDHRNEGLPGATFRLYFDEACTAPYGNAVTSGESGRIYFGKLAAGTYYLKETDAPDGYYENDTIYELTVTGSGRTLRPLNSESPIPAVIQNNPIPVSLNIHKVDGGGQPLTGADFELYMRNSDGDYGKIDIIIDNKPVNWLPVDGNGNLTIPDLLPGEYKLVEVHAPAGYYRMTEDIFFTVVPGGISCENSPGIWTFNSETNTITVTNVTGSELPQTGGMGTHYGTMAGLLMMAGSLLYGFLLRRKRERGTA